jgi:hypothetical protein
MREIRLYGSEGGGAGRSPYPYQKFQRQLSVSGPPQAVPRLIRRLWLAPRA